MKFNHYQEEAILESLALQVPVIDSKELWYGYLSPFFNEKFCDLEGNVQLASSRAELQRQLEVIAMDFIRDRIEMISHSIAMREALWSTVSENTVREIAQLMERGIAAVFYAIRHTNIIGQKVL